MNGKRVTHWFLVFQICMELVLSAFVVHLCSSEFDDFVRDRIQARALYVKYDNIARRKRVEKWGVRIRILESNGIHEINQSEASALVYGLNGINCGFFNPSSGLFENVAQRLSVV